MKILDIDPMPHLYLDMDGVQADLFHEVSRRIGTNWHDLPDQEKDDAFTQLSSQGPDTAYALFRILPALPGGAKIITWLHEHNIPYTVLSAPLRNEGEASIRGKKDWLDDHYPGSSETALFTKRKFKYATTNGRPNVLVDDYNYYLHSWSEHGGIAVKHSEDSTDHTIKQLEKIYSPYLNK
jgi:hypothetical protein